MPIFLSAKAQVPHQFCAPVLQYISFLYLLMPMFPQGKALDGNTIIISANWTTVYTLAQ
jgi:hypothetical protein